MIGMLLAASLASAPILRLHVSVWEYGIRGTGIMTVDRRDGRYARRFDVGPASDAEGYDGRAVWIADAANNVYIQGNADTRDEALHWSSLLRRISSRASPSTVRIRVGNDAEVVTFSDYRREAGGSRIPFAMRIRDQQGTRELHVTSVEHLEEISKATFAPPATPNNASVRNPSGVTSVPFLPERLAGHSLPLVVIPVRVDNGPLMPFWWTRAVKTFSARPPRRGCTLDPKVTLEWEEGAAVLFPCRSHGQIRFAWGMPKCAINPS